MKYMRVFTYIVAGTLVFLGLAMVGLLPNTPEYASKPLEPISAGLLLFAWGLALYLATRHRYRGGAPGYIGAVLFGLGVWNAIGVMSWKNGTDFAANILASILLVAGGVALLRHVHKARVAKSQ